MWQLRKCGAQAEQAAKWRHGTNKTVDTFSKQILHRIYTSASFASGNNCPVSGCLGLDRVLGRCRTRTNGTAGRTGRGDRIGMRCGLRT